MPKRGRRGGCNYLSTLRRALGALVVVVLLALVCMPSEPAHAAAMAPPADQTLMATGIRSQQMSVVAANHQGPLNAARFAVADFESAAAQDARAVAADRSAQAAAETLSERASARVGGDEQRLEASAAALSDAEERLAGDRDRLRVIAVGMYTGALTDPQPASLRELEAEQNRIIDAAEVEVVAGVVDAHLHTDLASVAVDGRRRDADAAQLTGDRSAAATEAAAATAAQARTVGDARALAADQAKLAAANRQLDGQETALAADLSSVAGPPTVPAGQLSLLGSSALTAGQMAGWYTAQGYVDLTAATIQQLASWYVEAGSEEGVRGDVAFAQAVLETGGFSSPDAVDLSNFAGIGHCDTCASGWAFPSPKVGVLGQVQLLRIFADAGPGPSQAPPPAVPSLVPARQMSAGRCPTVESLTGVWATDPGYGQSILSIYGQMLAYALSGATSS